MYTCSGKNCRTAVDDAQADAQKGVCLKCGMGLADDKGLGWAHNDSLKAKPVNPTSLQSKQAAKAQAPSGPSQPVAVFTPPQTQVVLTPQQNKLALKKKLNLAQIAAFTPQQKADFDAEALKEV